MRFFFDVRTPDAVVLDLIGDILPDAEIALEEARKAACELACNALRGSGETIPLVVPVRDESGVAVGSVDVLHAVTDVLVGKAKGSDFLPANDCEGSHTAPETRFTGSLSAQSGAS